MCNHMVPYNQAICQPGTLALGLCGRLSLRPFVPVSLSICPIDLQVSLELKKKSQKKQNGVDVS